ncbi:hypothetical protein TorRG33x02_012920 [Trema orientale]|uniref:Uncharacterized protein n=1 Tax=Trema orientale TaxID=63057 RepID=A0A2P5FZM4_TREOI|nr:hypothetical protein TorRG33x02_012920 [Trema orientale]
MVDLWKWRYDVLVTELDPGIFLFQFGCAGDQRRVLLGEPWHFSNHPIVLGVPDAMTHISVDSLTKIPFWIQIYRLPFLSKSKALGKMIGEWLGDFLEVDTASLLEGWGPYMHIRIFLDVSKPLLWGKMLKLPQYLKFLELEDQGVMHSLPYGPWMHGTPPKTAGIDRY